MPQTSNKGYEVQATGSNTNTWGDVLNDDVIQIIDDNIGGIVTKTLSNVQVDLTTEESQQLICRLTGVLTGNVLVTTLCNGMTLVENLTTGSFTVTFSRFGVGSPVTIAQNTRALIITDPTNGARTGADNQTEFASGTRLVFNQTSAPTGYTKENSATYNEAALQFTTGSVGTGGSVAFGTAFTSRALSGTVGNTTLTESQIPAHRHFLFADVTSGNTPISNTEQPARESETGSSGNDYTIRGSATEATVGRSAATGGGQAHNHSLSINNLDLAVKYVSCIIAQKN